MQIKRKSAIGKRREHLEEFCQILNNLPLKFKFTLENTGKNFNGFWEKIPLQRGTGWQNGSKILHDSSCYPFKKKVFEAIEKEGFPLKEIYFPKMTGRIFSSLTKGKTKELNNGQKRSLQDIAKEYGCTRQWMMLLMEKKRIEEKNSVKSPKGSCKTK